MAKHASHVHRRVPPPSPSLNSPQTFEASQMRDRLTVAREHLNEALVSRGVLSFHNDINQLRHDELSLAEDRRRILHEKNLRAASQRHFLVNGAVAEHGYNRRQASVVSQRRMLWLPQPVRDEFYKPRQTVVCIRRQTRRRVLFALRQIGRGSGAKPRKAKWSEASRIVCRR